jgi:hypothetical protein
MRFPYDLHAAVSTIQCWARDDSSVHVMAKKSHPSTCRELARVEKQLDNLESLL